MDELNDKLKTFCLAAARHTAVIASACETHDIKPGPRRAMFLATLAHESGGFQYAREIWGPTDQQRKYEPPSKLARGLGNTQIGDGRRFLGRGWIMTTGRANTLRVSKGIFGDDRLIHDPRWLETPEGAAQSSAWFWTQNKLNALADAGNFIGVQGVVNVGRATATATQIIGYPDRRRWHERAVAAAL